MGVTNYSTYNGRIRSETTAGVMTSYLTDALGSVTATVNSAGVVQNTYRYRPYGGLLTKTGTAPDPAFMWTGDSNCSVTICLGNCPQDIDWEWALMHEMMHCCGASHSATGRGDVQAEPDCLEDCIRGVPGWPTRGQGWPGWPCSWENQVNAGGGGTCP